jgi:5-hydroxytryptamine receptor 1
LAIADLIVGIVVMSPKAIIEVVYFGEWHFGAIFCDIWYTTFILCTSASILHLLVIAIDRYLTVTKTNYSLSRNWKKISVMIFMAWFLGLIVAIGPISGWRDYEKFLKRIDKKVCYVTYKLGFIIFSQITLCYAPVAIIIPLYYVIYTVNYN